MKNWLSIGRFSKQVGLSTRTLRIYEEMGLICSHARGENGYRYYQESQLKLAARIKRFKALGFSLSEIKSLLQADSEMDFALLTQFLQKRLRVISSLEKNLANQAQQIKIILSSPENATTGLSPNERKFIMSHFEKISVVVTGVKDLKLTAENIQKHLAKSGQTLDVIHWDVMCDFPEKKPYILVVPEALLGSEKLKHLMPDVVVIKNLSQFSPETEKAYLNLYHAAGPHMTTIFNADDRISVELAANEEIRKGKIFYFSKNSGLENQIERIGGVISDGEVIRIFRFNSGHDLMSFSLNRPLAFDEETALLASLAAVMDVGLDRVLIGEAAY